MSALRKATSDRSIPARTSTRSSWFTKLETASFRTRRKIALTATLCACLAYGAWFWLKQTSLADTRWLSGVTLLACLIILILLGVRRRLPVLPLGGVSTWTQVHLYTGLFAGFIYVLHVPVILADGVLEFWLSFSFLFVTASGLYGIFATRSIPKKLTAVEGQHRFDQVSWHRERLRLAANQLVDDLDSSASGELVKSHYHQKLSAYFEKRPTWSYLIRPHGRRRRQRLNELAGLHRYLDEPSQVATGKLSALVRHRDDVDYQFALQLRLRAWVAMHATMSIVLMVLAMIHAVLAIRFTS